MPFPAMNSTARASRDCVATPALLNSNRGGRMELPIASAIWLRQALFRSKKRTRNVSVPLCLANSPVHM